MPNPFLCAMRRRLPFYRDVLYRLKVAAARLRKPKYGLPRGYLHRSTVQVFDDSTNRDEYQNEVYAFARAFYEEQQLHGVLDIGCGSGFKLMKYFSDVPCAGAETDTAFLRQNYPDARWFEVFQDDWKQFPAELVIAADVIEHVPDPDAFLRNLLEHHNAQWFLFSTPDRNLDPSPWTFGPPPNECHFREWSFEEFEAFLGTYFHLRRHEISNTEQRTQMLLATRLKDYSSRNA
jgi:SAM-dependent methyltransferase